MLPVIAIVLSSLPWAQVGEGPTPGQMAGAIRQILPYFEIQHRTTVLQLLGNPEALVKVEGGKKRLEMPSLGASFDLQTGEFLSFHCSLALAEPRQASDAEIEARAKQLLDALPPIQRQGMETWITRYGLSQDDLVFRPLYGSKPCSNGALFMFEAKTGRLKGFMLQPRLNHAKFGTAPFIGREQALAAAQSAYQAVRPYPSARVGEAELWTGVPVAYRRPEADKFLAVWDLPDEVRNNRENRVAIPFWEIVIEPLAVEPTAEGSSSMQVVIVDARNGRPLVVEPIFLRGGSSPLGPSKVPGSELDAVVSGVKGKLRRVEASAPSGLRLSFTWGDELRLGRYDADRELLWVRHEKNWLPYRATSPLLEALTQASRPSAFGKSRRPS